MSDQSPIPFPAAPNVPIVGQPCTVLTWFPTVSLVCNCEAKQPLLVVGLGNLSICPACGRGFQLFGVKHSTRPGAAAPPHFDINIVLQAPGPAAEQ